MDHVFSIKGGMRPLNYLAAEQRPSAAEQGPPHASGRFPHIVKCYSGEKKHVTYQEHAHWGSTFLACATPFCLWKVHCRQRGVGWNVSHLHPLEATDLISDWLIQTCGKRIPNHEEPSVILCQREEKKGSTPALKLATSAVHLAMDEESCSAPWCAEKWHWCASPAVVLVGLASLCSRFDSANQKRGLWCLKGPNVRRSSAASRPHSHSLVYRHVWHSWYMSSISSPQRATTFSLHYIIHARKSFACIALSSMYNICYGYSAVQVGHLNWQDQFQSVYSGYLWTLNTECHATRHSFTSIEGQTHCANLQPLLLGLE